MKNTRFSFFICFGALLGLIYFTQKAEATLGEPVESVTTDQKAISGVRRSAENRQGFTVERIETGSSEIREYVNPNGIVFGVAWQGSTPPHLDKLLGSYSGEYNEARAKKGRRVGRGNRRTASSRMVVEHFGHMRGYRGRAYVPALMPAGVRANDIE